jgi:hypothetical protein
MMGEPDIATEHESTETLNVREFWPTLTDQDVRAMNTWSWRVHRYHSPRDTPGSSARKLSPRGFHIRLFRRREIGR